MARRTRRTRNNNGLPAKPFDDALTALTVMERRACYRTVTCKFTPQDILEWLIEPGFLAKLKHAEDVRRELDAVAQIGYRVTQYDPTIIMGEAQFALHVDTSNTPYTCPKDGIWSFQETAMASHITDCLLQVYEVHCRFSQARKVVRWFDDHGTMGSTKFYFPTIASLLPGNHPIHEASGDIYREPRRPVAEIAADAREAMTTIAMGLLTAETEHEARDVKVEIVHKNGTKSQMFCLV